MSIAEENAKYFNEMADSYDDKEWHKKAFAMLSAAIYENLDWIGVAWAKKDDKGKSDREVRLLDYACGTGFITKTLAPHITSATGMDVSSSMVDVYNAFFSQRTSSKPELPAATALVGNLLEKDREAVPKELSQPEYFGYDIAVVGLGFHHFEDATEAARRLTQRLKPGGVLFIVDFLHDGEHGHQHHHDGHGHGHNNPEQHAASGHHQAQTSKADQSDWEVFDISKIPKQAASSIKVASFGTDTFKKHFEDAGLEDVQLKVLPEKMHVAFHEKPITRTVFFARGKKPVA